MSEKQIFYSSPVHVVFGALCTDREKQHDGEWIENPSINVGNLFLLNCDVVASCARKLAFG